MYSTATCMPPCRRRGNFVGRPWSFFAAAGARMTLCFRPIYVQYTTGKRQRLVLLLLFLFHDTIINCIYLYYTVCIYILYAYLYALCGVHKYYTACMYMPTNSRGKLHNRMATHETLEPTNRGRLSWSLISDDVLKAFAIISYHIIRYLRVFIC